MTTAATAPANAVLHQHRFPNGLTLVVQPMEGLASAAFSLLLPTGVAGDREGGVGAGVVMTEWLPRGAGERDSRTLSDHLDSLGLQRGQGCSRESLSFGGVLPAEQLPAAVEAYADILRRPRLDEEEFELARDLILQELDANADQPMAKFSRALWGAYWPWPLSRPVEGVREDLEALTAAGLREEISRRIAPAGAIFAVAGGVEFAAVRDLVAKWFGGWSGSGRQAEPAGGGRAKVTQVREPLEQQHVALVCEAPVYGDGDHYDMTIVAGVLSGGMGARLFTEVREKRSLCYSVSAGVYHLRGRAAMLAYANPKPEVASQTVDVLLEELRKLNREGITADELARAKVGVRSRLVRGGESSRSRAGTIATDQYHLGRVRSTDEVLAGLDGVTVGSVRSFLERRPFRDFSLATLGPLELPVPDLG